MVYDDKEDIDLAAYPADVAKYPRDELNDVQMKFSKYKGVSAIVYVQTCAAEKRRRRKRGQFPDPDKRVFINTDICEGCGDCGVQSNCVSIVPVETGLGRKRAIDQSTCNKDFSCVKGFCPSFVTVEGAKIRKEATTDIDLPDMPQPAFAAINGTHNIVMTGVGGTGIVTIGAVLAMAAHMDGKGAGMMEMSGLAQKGGAVQIHCRIAESPNDIKAIRVAIGECDTLIGGDLVVSGGAKTIGLMQSGRTRGVVNAHEIMTGAFTRDTEFRLPSDQLTLALSARMSAGFATFDASDLAKALLGDSIYANMMVFGAAWQMGTVPVSYASILGAIKLNGAAVDQNLKAFEMGRWAYLHPKEADGILSANVVPLPQTLAEKIAFRENHARAYQGNRLAKKYRRFVDRFGDSDLQEAVAISYHKLLTYKDEYEVARLLIQTREKAQAEFDGDLKLTYHLAPPVLSKTGADGRPAKREFGARMAWAFPKLAKLKMLRGTPFDPFGRTTERRMERALIKQYEADMQEVLRIMRPDTRDAAIALARLPLDIRGFGPVKDANARKVAKRREELLAALRAAPVAQAAE